MTVRPHRSGIAHSFSAAAGEYDRWARPQRVGAKRLAGMLQLASRVQSVLDLGCGTGMLLRLLHARFAHASFAGVDVAPGMIEACRHHCRDIAGLTLWTADIENFVCSARFHLIVSNFCFQWLRDRDAAIGRLCRLLRPDGQFAVAVPVTGSLTELAVSYRAAIGDEMPGLDFVPSAAYLHALERAGLKIERAEVETAAAWFDRGIDVLRYFKATGTMFRDQPGYRPRSVPELRRLMRHYETAHADATGRLPLTFRVLYVLARKDERGTERTS